MHGEASWDKELENVIKGKVWNIFKYKKSKGEFSHKKGGGRL